MKRYALVTLLVCVLTLAACSTPTAEPTTVPAVDYPSPTTSQSPVQEPVEEDVYPAPVTSPQTDETAYPEPIDYSQYADAAYPDPVEGDGTPFVINQPVLAGSTLVSGSGLAGVPIVLIDVTMAGQPIAQGEIGKDGTFAFNVRALEAGHRIGIAIGVLDGTEWNPEDFNDESYFGELALLVPTIGFFYDTAMVVEP